MSRSGALAACVALLGTLGAGTAAGSLLPGLPSVPTTPTVSTPTLPPDPTGTVGGIVDGTTGTVGGVIEGVLGSAPGSTGGTLPVDTVAGIVDGLLGGGTSTGGGTGGGGGGTSGGGTGSTGSSGGTPTANHTSGGAGGVVSGPAYSANDGVDRTAPSVRFTILSKLRQAARTGRLRLRVGASEPAVVAFTTLLRPGRAARVHGRVPKLSRKLIRIKSVVLAFHRAGSLTLAVRLPKAARHNLARTRDARVAIETWASDLARNQARRNIKRTIR